MTIQPPPSPPPSGGDMSTRLAVILIGAFLVALVTGLLTLATGALWPVAALAAGPAFGGSIFLFDWLLKR